jgi:hypothetical protein
LYSLLSLLLHLHLPLPVSDKASHPSMPRTPRNSRQPPNDQRRPRARSTAVVSPAVTS